MPYHEVFLRADENPSLDLALYTALAPSDHWHQFSYASELVTHDGAISALLSMENALDRIEQDFGIVTETQRQWVHDELIRLWKVRGPFPDWVPFYIPSACHVDCSCLMHYSNARARTRIHGQRSMPRSAIPPQLSPLNAARH